MRYKLCQSNFGVGEVGLISDNGEEISLILSVFESDHWASCKKHAHMSDLRTFVALINFTRFEINKCSRPVLQVVNKSSLPFFTWS